MSSLPRIVSLLPSATEIVCVLGAADGLVGISHECDYPESVRDRQVLTASRIRLHATSADIDRDVRLVLRDALSIYTVDERALAELAPDIIVTQDLCEVCAVSLDDVRAAVVRLAHRDAVDIVSLRPTTLADVLGDIERVGEGIGRRDQARSVRELLEARIRSIAARSAKIAYKPRVVTLEWIDPLMLGGTWMPELIHLAGGVAAGAEVGQPAPTITAEGFTALQAEVVLIKPCGFSLARSLSERPVLERIVSWAGRQARVYLSDGNAFFNRPGPRLVESLEIMAACAHPEVFADFAHKHTSVIVPLG